MRRLGITATLTLVACASPEQRIAAKLVDYGFSRDSAQCLADQLEERLSHRQLQTLADVARDLAHERDVRRMTVGDLLDRVRRLDDPELIAVLARAGAGCALLNT